MILVTGLTGMVGKYLQEMLDAANLSYMHLSRHELDLKNIDSIHQALMGKKFNYFIHLAAETNVDLCETNPEHAYTCNYYATKMIAEYCEKIGARMIFVSSAAVFGSQHKVSYHELDVPEPVNLYGLSKLHAELAIQKICHNYFIIRAGWMIGGGVARDNKFVGKLLAQLHEGKTNLTAVFDKFGSITSAKHLAKFIIDTLDNPFVGIKHMTSYDMCSRYEIAQRIAKAVNDHCTVKPVSSALYPLPAPRSASEAIHSIISADIIEETSYSWSALIDQYLKDEFHVKDACFA